MVAGDPRRGQRGDTQRSRQKLVSDLRRRQRIRPADDCVLPSGIVMDYDPAAITGLSDGDRATEIPDASGNGRTVFASDGGGQWFSDIDGNPALRPHPSDEAFFYSRAGHYDNGNEPSDVYDGFTLIIVSQVQKTVGQDSLMGFINYPADGGETFEAYHQWLDSFDQNEWSSVTQHTFFGQYVASIQSTEDRTLEGQNLTAHRLRGHLLEQGQAPAAEWDPAVDVWFNCEHAIQEGSNSIADEVYRVTLETPEIDCLGPDLPILWRIVAWGRWLSDVEVDAARCALSRKYFGEEFRCT